MYVVLGYDWASSGHCTRILSTKGDANLKIDKNGSNLFCHHKMSIPPGR